MTYDEILLEQLANIKEHVIDPLEQEAKARIEDKWNNPEFHAYYSFYRHYGKKPHDIAETMAWEMCK